MIIRYGEEEVLCRVRTNEAITGRIRIHVHPTGEVEIEAPDGTDDAQIRKAAQRRARWIFGHRQSALAARQDVRPRDYVSGETHFYLGRRHKLIVEEAPDSPSTVKLLRGKIVVTLPVADRTAVRRRLHAWYRQRAQDYLGSRLSEIGGRIPWVRSLPPMKLMHMKTQWGSCSPEGMICLNPALVRAPRHCVDYVVIHELCHLVEHNHGKRFFDLLSRHCPRWEAAKKELDSLAELILAGDG